MILFVPSSDAPEAANLSAFIRFCKQELSAFKPEAWESDRWHDGEAVAIFSTNLAPRTAYSFTPMSQPFKDFAKAYVRYRYSLKPVTSVCQWLGALRCIEAALFDVHGHADIALLDMAVMDRSAQKAREMYASETSWLKTGLEIRTVFNFCREKCFVRALPHWKPPFRTRPVLAETLTAEGTAHRASRLPKDGAMLKLADLFAVADDVETKYYSSIMMLLMVAPSRISEVFHLSTDCIGWEEDERGEKQMFLRWRASKGKGWTKKWIIPSMREVVAEAVNRLVEIGAPAREAALFAHRFPDTFMPHHACLSDPAEGPDRQLTSAEFCAALSIAYQAGWPIRQEGPAWSRLRFVGKWVCRLMDGGITTYRELGKYVNRTYRGKYWPYIDPEKVVPVWEALCLHRENEFRKWATPRHFSWRLPCSEEVSLRFQHSYDHSLFERYGLRNDDGSAIKLTPHQPRHWLSTMCERAGMDEFTLARWAGRARVEHNRHYDHRTPEERLSTLRNLMPQELPSVVERIRQKQPVTYQELGVELLGTAKATLYGMCTHDYAMAPCQKLRECMTCSDHVCIKGDHVTLERIRVLEEQTALLLKRALVAHDEGVFGADRWVDSHKWKLAHVRAMRMALESPDVPEGAVFRVPEGHDPSPVARALMQSGRMVPTDIESLKAPTVRLPPPEGRHA